MNLFLVIVSLSGLICSSPLEDRNDAGTIPADHPTNNFQRDEGKPDHAGPRQIQADPDSLTDLGSSGISPLSDNGRSEVLDFSILWDRCPRRYLNCARCPRDPRCRRRPLPLHAPNLPRPSKVPPKSVKPTAGDAKECDLDRCGGSGGGECDPSTVCINGYCACRRDLKAAEGNMFRGWLYGEALTVFVDAGVVCDQPCNRVFGSEVERRDKCIENDQGGQGIQPGPQLGGQDGLDVGAQGQTGLDDAITLKKGHGAIQVPGAGFDDSNRDYVAGVAAAGGEDV